MNIGNMITFHSLIGSGQGYSDIILGTLDDPSSQAGNLTSTGSWFMMQSLPVTSTLKQFKVYCAFAGNVKIKIAQPVKGGGFNIIHEETKACSLGLNTFSVADGTLTETEIPAYSLVGIHTPASGGATVPFLSGGNEVGYLSGTGDLSGNGVLLNSASYTSLIQAQYTVSIIRSGHSSYWIDEDFAGTTLPAYGINNTTTPWVFSAGKITNAGVGLANFFDFYPTSNEDRHTFAVEFEFKAVGDRFAIYKKPFLGGSSVDAGTIGEVDLNNNQLILYQTWGGSTVLPAPRTSLILTNLTLTIGVRYRLELIKTSRQNQLKITNTITSDTETLTHDTTASELSGKSFGRPGFAALAGTIDVRSAQLYPTVLNPGVLIVGDSITEGSGTTDALCFAQLVLNQKGGNGWFSGDGGTDSTNCRRRLRHMLRLSTPRFVVVYIGANNANSDAQTLAFETDLPIMYDAIVNAGATPVICTVTPNSNATFNDRVQTMNTFLLGTGWRLCRFDIALSLNNDGSTYNPSLMFDGVHPNADGHAALLARLQTDFPEMF